MDASQASTPIRRPPAQSDGPDSRCRCRCRPFLLWRAELLAYLPNKSFRPGTPTLASQQSLPPRSSRSRHRRRAPPPARPSQRRRDESLRAELVCFNFALGVNFTNKVWCTWIVDRSNHRTAHVL
jgi:hypothetical protein